MEVGEPVDLGEPVTSAPLAARLRVPSGPAVLPRHGVRPGRRGRSRRLSRARPPGRRGRGGRGLRLLRHRRVPRAHARGVPGRAYAPPSRRRPGGCRSWRAPGYGTALAVRYARLAEEAGADGLLAMPPYLVVAGQEGLLRHYRELAAATSLPVIVYQRDNAVFTPETVVELARTEGIIGLKDGARRPGPDAADRQRRARRSPRPGDFLYFNGLPTAELTSLAYRGHRRHPVLVGRLLLRPRDRPRLPPGARRRRRRDRGPAARRLLPALRRTARAGPRLRRLAGQGRGTAAGAGRGRGAAAAARAGRGTRQAARAS